MTDSTARTDEADAFDPAALDRLVRFGGAKLLTAMVGTFRTNGRERLEAGRAALAAGDAAGAKLAFHSLKSSSAQLGAMSLSQACADAEALASEGRLDEIATALPGIDRAFDAAVAWMDARGSAPGATP